MPTAAKKTTSKTTKKTTKTATSAKAKKSTRTHKVTSKTPSPEQIRSRAFELYKSRGSGHGNDLQDWLQAEAELTKN